MCYIRYKIYANLRKITLYSKHIVKFAIINFKILKNIMRNNNEYSFTEGIGGFGASGQPSTVVAPTFIQPNPTSAYAPPVTAPYANGLGFGNGGILEGILLAGLLGGNRHGYGFGNGEGAIPGTTVLEQNVSNLRKDVADNGKEIHVLGNEIAAMFAQQNMSNAGEFRNIDNQICEVEKEAIKAGYESKIATLQSTNEITNKIDASTVDIKNQLFGISTVMAAEFCKTNHNIERGNAALSLQMERGFNKLTEDDLRDKIAVLRDERECSRRAADLQNFGIITGNQTASIANLLENQLGKATNQIIQMGAGNLATPVATNTQTDIN